MTNFTHTLCPQCGTIHPMDDRYCSVCGASLEEAQLVTVTATARKAGSPIESVRHTNWHLIVSLVTLGILILFAGATVALLLAHLATKAPIADRSSAPQVDLAARALDTSEAPQPATEFATTEPGALVTSQARTTPEAQSSRIASTEPPPSQSPEPTSESASGGEQHQATVTAEAMTTTASGPSEDQDLSTCTSWRDAWDYVGTDHCLCGTVTGTYLDPNSKAFFINFSQDRSAFYAVSFDWHEDLEGDCIQVCGTVEDYKGRPQIVIRDPVRQVASCP